MSSRCHTPDAALALSRFPVDARVHGAGLTVTDELGRVRRALADHGALVLHAPPGTGKTTVLPPALAGWAAETASGSALSGTRPGQEPAGEGAAPIGPGRVLVTQPRRVAVRAAWRRLHAAAGGDDRAVGYTVRGDSVGAGASAVEFLTPGVLVRRLLADPELGGVSAVVLDEVHERDLDTDLLFGLLADLRQLREDLSLVAMSATLDAEALAARWAAGMGQDHVPVVRTAEVVHPLTIDHRPHSGSRLTPEGRVDRDFLDHVARVTAQAHARSLAEDPGTDALVFLPGVAEVEAVADRLRGHAARHGRALDVLTLHGRQDPQEQDAALAGRAGAEAAPRVVVATNVAESSLTVPGVRVVVDSALAREPRRDAGRDMTGLVTVQVSRAAARQRAGRAGRLGPGHAVHCCSEAALGTAPAAPTPQLAVADLAPLALRLAAWGALAPMLDPAGRGPVLPEDPPAGALARASVRLRELGALDADHRVTDHGARLARMPVDPSLGHALLSAAAEVGPRAAAEAVALLAADVRAPGADLARVLADLRSPHEGNARSQAPPGTERVWRHEARRLESLVGPSDRVGARKDSPAGEEAVGLVAALAAPQRIARRVEDDEYLLVSGTRARLPRESPLSGRQWLAVAEVQRVGDGAVIRAAAELSGEQALRAGAGLQRTVRDAHWDAGRLRGRQRRMLGGIELDSRAAPVDADTAADAVVRAWTEHGSEGWGGDPARGLRRRVQLLHHRLGPPWPDMRDAALAGREDLTAAIGAELARGVPRDRVDLAGALQGLLPWPDAARLDELAPERLPVPSGRRVAVEYPDLDDEDGAPVLAAKLQEFFGAEESPTVADGTTPVLLHLLSPAGRPLAVTADLPSFWSGAYAQVRAESRGRYPKHPWPEDPTVAEPTALTRARARGR